MCPRPRPVGSRDGAEAARRQGAKFSPGTGRLTGQRRRGGLGQGRGRCGYVRAGGQRKTVALRGCVLGPGPRRGRESGELRRRSDPRSLPPLPSPVPAVTQRKEERDRTVPKSLAHLPPVRAGAHSPQSLGCPPLPAPCSHRLPPLLAKALPSGKS